WLGPARPAWVALGVIYWQLHHPRHTGFLLSWCAGLLLDGLTSSALGEHALALIVVAFCTLKLARYLRDQPLWEQSLVILPLLVLYEFILFWVDGVLGRSAPMLWRWLPILSSILIWPFFSWILDNLTRRTA